MEFVSRDLVRSFRLSKSDADFLVVCLSMVTVYLSCAVYVLRQKAIRTKLVVEHRVLAYCCCLGLNVNKRNFVNTKHIFNNKFVFSISRLGKLISILYLYLFILDHVH